MRICKIGCSLNLFCLANQSTLTSYSYKSYSHKKFKEVRVHTLHIIKFQGGTNYVQKITKQETREK